MNPSHAATNPHAQELPDHYKQMTRNMVSNSPHHAQQKIMKRSAKFWDKMAARYSKKPVADQATYEKKLQITREYLQPDMDVLEIGCGTGSTAIAHAPFVKHIHATDISGEMIEIARNKATAQKVSNVTFEQLAADQFDPSERSFDVVLGLSILHLIDNWESTIKKAYKTLKPGGVFITSTPCIGDSMKIFKFLGPVGWYLGLLPKLKVFTQPELETALTQAGFEIDYQWQPAKGKALFIVAKKTR